MWLTKWIHQHDKKLNKKKNILRIYLYRLEGETNTMIKYSLSDSMETGTVGSAYLLIHYN